MTCNIINCINYQQTLSSNWQGQIHGAHKTSMHRAAIHGSNGLIFLLTHQHLQLHPLLGHCRHKPMHRRHHHVVWSVRRKEIRHEPQHRRHQHPRLLLCLWRLAGFLYQRASQGARSGTCMGSRCCSLTFWYGAVSARLGLLSFALYLRTRRLYSYKQWIIIIRTKKRNSE